MGGFMKLFLIRHGESMQNTKENQLIGLPDHKVYLTKKGKEEAFQAGNFLKEYLEKYHINLFNSIMWVSPYERTRETAEIINNILNIKTVKEDYALVEQRYGLFDDKNVDDLRVLYPDQFNNYDKWYQNEGKFYAKLPQGEAPMDVAIRTRLFLQDVYRDNNDVVFIVSHGTTLRKIVMNIKHYSPEWFSRDPKPENCSIRRVDILGDITKERYIYNEPKVRKLTKN